MMFSFYVVFIFTGATIGLLGLVFLLSSRPWLLSSKLKAAGQTISAKMSATSSLKRVVGKAQKNYLEARTHFVRTASCFRETPEFLFESGDRTPHDFLTWVVDTLANWGFELDSWNLKVDEPYKNPPYSHVNFQGSVEGTRKLREEEPALPKVGPLVTTQAVLLAIAYLLGIGLGLVDNLYLFISNLPFTLVYVALMVLVLVTRKKYSDTLDVWDYDLTRSMKFLLVLEVVGLVVNVLAYFFGIGPFQERHGGIYGYYTISVVAIGYIVVVGIGLAFYYVLLGLTAKGGALRLGGEKKVKKGRARVAIHFKGRHQYPFPSDLFTSSIQRVNPEVLKALTFHLPYRGRVRAFVALSGSSQFRNRLVDLFSGLYATMWRVFGEVPTRGPEDSESSPTGAVAIFERGPDGQLRDVDSRFPMGPA